MSSITSSLRDLSPDRFHKIDRVRPCGTLQARRHASRVSFYWRYSFDKKSERVLIGIYDSSAPPKKLEPTEAGFSVAAAMRAAETLALEHYNSKAEGGRPALVRRKTEAVAHAAAEATRKQSATLEHLLAAYCDYLESLGRQSHRNVRSIFQLHVLDAFPELASKAATDVTADEFATVMRRLVDYKKARTSNKLRSYARAAYQVALASRTKASIPARFKDFGLRSNPVAETQPDETANKTAKNPLSLEQLRTYWRLIKDSPGMKGSLLRLHLLTGGQRIEQLVRLHTHEAGRDDLVLYDGKGRPGHGARMHRVPLIKEARAALAGCQPNGEYAISTTGGVKPVAGTTLSGWAQELVSDAIPGFTAKRIRSGVSTALAAAGVSRETRGHLQSHGVAGVQARHYDGHEYMGAKREALEVLFNLLNETPRRRARRGEKLGSPS